MQISPKLRYLIACTYISFISVLFCLPGSAFPTTNWFSKVYFDKWVHIGIFSFLITVSCWAFDLFKRKQIASLMVIAALYGISIEFIQKWFIPNRSFDITDWMADITGALIGWFIWNKLSPKK